MQQARLLLRRAVTGQDLGGACARNDDDFRELHDEIVASDAVEWIESNAREIVKRSMTCFKVSARLMAQDWLGNQRCALAQGPTTNRRGRGSVPPANSLNPLRRPRLDPAVFDIPSRSCRNRCRRLAAARES